MANKNECGVFCFHPRCLQRAGTIGCFVFMFGLANMASQSFLPYCSTQITSLERQYGFSSSQTGVIMASNDIGFTVFALLMGYLSKKVHIPKFLSFANLITVAGAIICTVPYFLSKDNLHGHSLSKLTDLPDVQTITMIKEIQQTPVGSLFDLEDTSGISGSHGELPSNFSTYNTKTELTTVSTVIVTNLSGIINNVRSTTAPSSSTTASQNGQTSPNPYVAMIQKFKEFLGEEMGNAVLKELRIGENGPPTFSDMKRLAKKVAGNETLFNQLPPKAQQRVLMVSRLFKRAASTSPMATGPMISDIASLNPFEMMMILAPVCSARPKMPLNCELMAKFRNKGFTNEYTGIAFACLAVGFVLQGIGKSPRLVMGLLYTDDNGNKLKTPLYFGIMTSMFALSVFVAFGTGVLTSRLYVTLNAVDIHPLNPHWIGAWWLGFLIIAGLAVVPIIFLVCFPRKLPKKQKHQGPSENGRPASCPRNNPGAGFLPALKRCFTNPVFVGLIFCGILMFLFGTGTTVFAPKYVETQFRVPAWKANIYIGLTFPTTSLIASFIAGIIMTKGKLTPLGTLKLALGFAIVFLVVAGVSMLFGCRTVQIVGHNAEILSESESQPNSTSCASACFCDQVDYFPVCGSNGKSYYSACHAGCRGTKDKTFTNCGCVAPEGTATLGLCPPEKCDMLGPYLGSLAVLVFCFTAMALMAIMTAFRSVPESDRGIAVAVFMFVTNLLGWMPGPIIYGRLVDSVCMMWRTKCAKVHEGACAVYDAERFRFMNYSWALIIGGLLICGLSFVIFKARNKTDWNSTMIGPQQAPTDLEHEQDGVEEKLMNAK